jgi:hypothetical protein
MVLPNKGDLKAKVLHDIQDDDQVKRLENLKSSLKKAYKEVRLNSQKAHQKDKAYCDKKAKERKFEVNDKVYLFCPARKPGRCHKFRSFWQQPFIVQKLSDLNYKIVNKKEKKSVVHINRLKKSYDQTPWSFENTRHPRKKTRLLDAETLDGDAVIQSRPIVTSEERKPQVVEAQALEEEQLQLDQDPQVHENVGTPVAGGDRRRQIPDSSVQDPDYKPSNSPCSRKELATTPIAPPVTRSHARLQLQGTPPV